MPIHPTALVDPAAQVPASCTIGPFCTVGPHVTLGEDCTLVSHVQGAVNHLDSKVLLQRFRPCAQLLRAARAQRRRDTLRSKRPCRRQADALACAAYYGDSSL